MIINKALIKKLNPCEDRLDNYIKYYKNKSFTRRQFMGLKNITHKDKLWVAFRLMDKNKLRFIAADIAELVLPIFESKYPNDLRPRKAIEAARAIPLDRNAAAANAAHAAAANATYAANYAAINAAYAAYAANYASLAAANAASAAYAAYAANYASLAAANATAAYAAYAAADAVYPAGFVSSLSFPGTEDASVIHMERKIRTIILKYWR